MMISKMAHLIIIDVLQIYSKGSGIYDIVVIISIYYFYVLPSFILYLSNYFFKLALRVPNLDTKIFDSSLDRNRSKTYAKINEMN